MSNKKLETKFFEILNSDKTKSPEKLNEVLKSDLFEVLKNYFLIDDDSILIKIEAEKQGATIKMIAKAKNVKAINYLK